MQDDRKGMRVDAVILAGAEASPELRKHDPARYEALISLGGKPMLRYVVDAVRESRYVERVRVVAPLEVCSDPGGFGVIAEGGEKETSFVECGGSIFESLRNGVESLPSQDRFILLVPGDLPLLRGFILDDFIERCLDRPADLYYSFVSKATNDAKFPGMKRTYQRLREGTLTAANMALFRPYIPDACESLIRKAIFARKKPWLMLGVMGPRCIFKYLLGTISVVDIERRFHELTGLVGRAVESPYAEVSCDVDKPSHLELVRRLLAGNETPTK